MIQISSEHAVQYTINPGTQTILSVKEGTLYVGPDPGLYSGNAVVTAAAGGSVALTATSYLRGAPYTYVDEGASTFITAGTTGGLQVAATVTAAAGAIAGQHNPADASTAGFGLVMTLPAGSAGGTLISVEKTDVSTNGVVVTGNIRGAAGATVTLKLQHETLELVADSSGSWWPVADSKPLTTLDARFVNKSGNAAGTTSVGPTTINAVNNFGAVGDDSTDNTAAFTAAMSSVISGLAVTSFANGAILHVPPGKYRFSTPFDLGRNVVLQGVGHSSRLRATANNFIINCNTGYRSSIIGLGFDAVTKQTAGGAIDYKNGNGFIFHDRLHFGNNLFCFGDVQASARSDYFWNNIQANDLDNGVLVGVTGCTNGWLLGDGVNETNQMFFSNISCKAIDSAGTGMSQWITCRRVDTLQMNNALFQNGDNGIYLKSSSSGVPNTSHQYANVALDGQGTTAWKVEAARMVNWSGCTLSGLGALLTGGGSPTKGALWILNGDATNYGFTWSGGVMQNMQKTPCVEYEGTSNGGLTISGTQFFNNNIDATAAVDVIKVAADAKYFKVVNCHSQRIYNNGVFIRVATGASDYYVVANNTRGPGGTQGTATFTDGGTGTNKTVTGNIT